MNFGARELFISLAETELIATENFRQKIYLSSLNDYRFSKSVFVHQTILHVGNIQHFLNFRCC